VDVKFLSLPWHEAAKEMVSTGVDRLCGIMGVSAWIHQINLAPMFVAAVWGLLSLGGEAHVIQYDQMKLLVTNEYWLNINSNRTTAVFWKHVEESFEDAKLRTKMNRALALTHKKALEEIMQDAHGQARFNDPKLELMRVEEFVRKWVQDCAGRTYAALENAGHEVTEDLLVTFFRPLISPPEDEENPDDNFSCIPPEVTMHIPPPDWAFLPQVASEFVADWCAEPKSKRKKTGGEDDDTSGPAPAATAKATAPPKATTRVPPKPVKKHKGHPECTSGEDCIGTAVDLKVRHLLDGSPADIYCEPCWNSFLEASADLEGEFED